jgi:Protein of unknown function (DUF3987)
MTTPPYNFWQPPISLGVLEIRPFPKEVFPLEIEMFVTELSRSTETPLDLAGVTVLSALATSAHDKYIIQIKTDYSEPVNLWTAVTLPPGCRKSAVLSAIMKPIIDFESTKEMEIKPMIDAAISKNKSLEARIKELRNEAAKDKTNKFESLQNQIHKLEQQIEEIPKIPQLWTADVTPENLATLMALNDECMAILSDEAGIFDTIGGRYSSGIPNLDLFLKSHSGTPARINRVGRPPDLLQRPILTMGLTPQPDILKGIGSYGTFRGRGLLGRFLYSLPRSNLGTRNLDAAPMPIEVKKSYHEVIKGILSHPFEKKNLHILRFANEAYERWRLHSLLIELQMEEGKSLALLTDWAGKLPGQIARIAALIHIARYAKEHPWTIVISLETVKAAISIGDYFISHAIATFELVGADKSLEGAKSILNWIEKNRLIVFTFRDCHYENKSRFKKAKDLEPCIEILVGNYFIREVESERKAHRPSRVFEVNPFLYQTET